MENTADPAGRADHDRVYLMIMGYWASQALRALADFSIAEHLAEGGLSAEQIAERASSDVAMTRRLLRAGVALELLRYDEATSVFSGTPLLDVLHGDSPVSLKNYARAAPGPAWWGPAQYLTQSVRTGRNHATEALGCSAFDFLTENPGEAALFSAAMTDLSAPIIADAIPHIDVAGAHSVVDVGGANGAFVCGLLQAHPQLRGIVFDLPHVAELAASEARRRGLGDRVTGVGGDFFAEVPPADLYLVKFILHDWSDEECTTILSNIRAGMREGARCYIAEMVVSDAAMDSAALMDLAMLAAVTGQERSQTHYDALLAAAGLSRTRVTHLGRPYVLIEAVAG